MNTIFFTKDKFESLKKQYDNLLIERKDAVFHLARAREMGDLKENGYYRASKSRLSSIDHSIREVSNFIKYGSVINFVNKGIIEIGSHATLLTNGQLVQYFIVGKEEADPGIGKISNESPLGRALIGKKTGETVNLKAPAGEINYKIIKIK